MTNPHFAWLPPEINSALMFAGPGAGPLLAAATAWDGLAADLLSAAASFGSVTSDLASGSWLGPSSTAMMTVATQYMGWLSAAAAQAEQVAGQAMTTVSAFETALTAMVQPAMVAANRGLVQLLAATNWLGQNAPAIMDIESAYEQMWALDVAAMASYHADAATAAARLAPWQQILRSIGIDISKNGQINLGWNNTGTGNIGIGNHGTGNFGSGNTGNNNVGSGNTGSSNLGLGNLGNGNIGFGNTGNWAIGFGLTGNHQIGFGGFNSGSGNVGFGNSGTDNTGFFNSGNGNSGIGNSGSQGGSGSSGTISPGFGDTSGMNTGAGNPGVHNTGMTNQASADSSLFSAGHFAATGAISTGTLGSGLLSSALGPMAGPHLAPANPNAALPSPPNAPGANPFSSFDSGHPNTNSSIASGGLKTFNTGFYPGNSGTNDLGLQNTPTPNLGIAGPGTAAAGIPKSNFYPTGNRAPADPGMDVKLQKPSE